jgi:hypothetical protein
MGAARIEQEQVQRSARHEVLTAVLMKNQLFWDVML